MGLDVYMYLNKDPEKYQELTKRLDELEYKTPEYNEVSSQIDSIQQRAEFDSVKYPEHMFKVGYLRSSYNAGGLNSVLQRTVGMDLYDIFQPKDDEYIVVPDWTASLQRAKDVLKTWKEYVELKGSFDVLEERFNPFVAAADLPQTGADALKKFFEQWEECKKHAHKRNPERMDWFSNRDGAYFMSKSPEIVAAIPGAQKSFLSTGAALPVMFLIYRKDKSEFDWYTQALEITVEMCEWVVNQKHYDGIYILHWSG